MVSTPAAARFSPAGGRFAARGQQYGVGFEARGGPVLREGDAHPVHRVAEGLHLDVQPEGDSTLFQNLADCLRDVAVLARDQFRESFEHGDLRTERGVHRRELQSDISAAHDRQPPGQFVQLHDRGADVYPFAFGDAGDGRERRFGPGVDDDVLSAELHDALRGLHLHGLRREEPPFAV